jgi:hypothetical protein
MLNKNLIPLYLQIACDKNSTIYNLIYEIASICDVNVGIPEKCTNNNYWSCGYEVKTVYPVHDVEKDLDRLSMLKDVPVIVDGHGSIKNYHALLREVANIPNKKSNMMRHNMPFPIFMCPSIKLSFRNILNMDLTSEIVSDEYVTLIRENKQILSSLVIDLVNNFIERLFSQTDEASIEDWYFKQKYPFSEEIANHMNIIRKSCTVTPQTAQNLGILSFFFTGFMRVFRAGVLDVDAPEKFEIKGFPKRKNIKEHITKFIQESRESLNITFVRFSPIPIESLNVDISAVRIKEYKRVEKRARMLAKEIVKSYQDYGTLLSVIGIKVRKERFIYEITLLPGTRSYKVFRDAGEVQAALRLQHFYPVKTELSLEIVVSESELSDNNLITILDSPAFAESKMNTPFALGYDLMGDMVIEDLAQLNHILVGGATGQGKSTALHALVLSIVSKQPPSKVRLLIFDFGVTYLTQFKNVPHLLMPIINDMSEGVNAIITLKRVMEYYRGIYIENPEDRSMFNNLPYIYCIIDEFPKFIRHGGREERRYLQELITELLEQGRGLKIRIVLAAQDPTEKNMKCGTTNLETCLAFRCRSVHNSHVMIRESGAEKLPSKGHMYYKSESHIGLRRLRGAYIDEKSLTSRLAELSFSYHYNSTGDEEYEFDNWFNEEAINNIESNVKYLESPLSSNGFESNLIRVVEILLKDGFIANKGVMKLLNKSFEKANDYMKELEYLGLIPPLNGGRGARLINPKELINIEKLQEIFMKHGYSEADFCTLLESE